MDFNVTVSVGDFKAGVLRDARLAGIELGYDEHVPSLDEMRAALVDRFDYRRWDIEDDILADAYTGAFLPAYTASRADVVAETSGTCTICAQPFYRDSPEQVMCYTCSDAR